MSELREEAEHQLIALLAEQVEQRRTTLQATWLDIESVAATMSLKLGTDISLRQVQQLADICLANGWLLPQHAGPNRYSSLSLTPRGFYAARVWKRQQDERPRFALLKKIASWCSRHKRM